MLRSTQLRSTTHGFSVVDSLFILVVAGIIALTGYSLLNHHTKKTTAPIHTASVVKTTSSASATNAYAILSPATVASKTAECSQQLTFDSNGDSGPITCPDGDLNLTEWNALAALEPSIFTLGPSPTVAQVQAALCADTNDSDSDANTSNSKIIEMTVYHIAQLYYGWSFTSDPTVVLSNGSC
jgi:hypothetical protein